MMHAQNLGKLENGWHLIARLHILERSIGYVKEDWDNRSKNIGFEGYSVEEFDSMRTNDWLVVSYSFASELDLRNYFDMMGIEYSQKARDQIASFGFDSVASTYYVSTDRGYCTQDDYGYLLGGPRTTVDVDGTSIYPY
jgi:hypothetical protein